MSQTQQVKLVASLLTYTLKKDLNLNGQVIPAGTVLVTYPITVDRAVMIGDQSLEDLWDTLSKTGHSHESAPKLETARTINGISFNGTSNITNYFTCTTASATQNKLVAASGFSLTTGAQIAVKFTNKNTASNPKLNVNSTGAKAICLGGANIAADRLCAGLIYLFVYDGTNFELVNGPTQVKHVTTLPSTVPSDLAKGGVLIVGQS